MRLGVYSRILTLSHYKVLDFTGWPLSIISLPYNPPRCEIGKRNMTEAINLLKRITVRPDIFGGKPIIRGMRFAVEHVLGKLAAGDSVETILSEHPFLEPEDIQACLVYAYRSLSGDRVHEFLSIQESE